MYEIIEQAKLNIQGYSLSGTVGSIPFSQKNVVGSFMVANKASNPSTFNLGNVSIGQLTGTLHGLNIPVNKWKGRYITPVVTIGNHDVPFPSKRYKIDDASHVNGLVTFTAYDDMEKFDKGSSISAGTNDTPYGYLALACEVCNVELGMTENQVKNLPNGQQPIALKELGDIETWRDVLYWVAVTCASFCFINREGKLELKPFHNTVDDEIPKNARYSGASYDDEIVTYTGINVNITDEKVVKYYAVAEDTGYTLNIGSDPFLQGPESQRTALANGILEGISGIEYISGTVEVPFGFHYDLGDVLQFPGRTTNDKFCIMGYEFTYNGRCRLTGIPSNKKTMSKTDKNIQGLLSNVSKNEVSSYEQRNTKAISIGDEEEKNIVSIRIASNTNTKAMIHIEVNLDTLANAPSAKYALDNNKVVLSDIWDGISETAVKGEVRYVINSEEDELHPKETWIDGNHVLHLMYILYLQQGHVTTFRAYMKSEGGTINIDRGGVWFYATGVGLVGDSKWSGFIDVEDVVEEFALIEITTDEMDEEVTFTLLVPTPVPVSDVAEDVNISEIPVEDVDETVSVSLHLYSFPRITEDGIVRVTEDKIARYTEGD